MNRRSLAALIVLNVVLLGAVVLTALAPTPAHAQFGGGADYMMISGRSATRSQQAVVYIIDKTNGNMVALFFNTSNNNLEIVGSRRISDDLSGPLQRR